MIEPGLNKPTFSLRIASSRKIHQAAKSPKRNQFTSNEITRFPVNDVTRVPLTPDKQICCIIQHSH